jgi:hypothetical protein
VPLTASVRDRVEYRLGALRPLPPVIRNPKPTPQGFCEAGAGMRQLVGVAA